MSIITKKSRKQKGFSKKSALMLAILLTFSLGMIGSAMALWQDSLTIEQTAGTGTFTPEFVANSTGDSIIPYDPDHNIQTMASDIDNSSASVNTINNVQMNNCYVGDQFTKHFTIKNNGTVPITIDNCTISPTPSNPGDITVTFVPVTLNPQEKASGILEVTIIDSMPDFAVTFPCHQWNLTYDSSDWKKPLILNCHISGPKR